MLRLVSVQREGAELQIIRQLFKEYAAELNENLCFQQFDTELHNPLKRYGTPSGSLLLAYWNDNPVGCVALQPLGEDVCEMKRLYVKQGFRKYGIGDKLVENIVAEGKKTGYKRMVLDTLARLTAALRLYKKNGFQTTTPYYENPLADVIFLEKLL